MILKSNNFQSSAYINMVFLVCFFKHSVTHFEEHREWSVHIHRGYKSYKRRALLLSILSIGKVSKFICHWGLTVRLLGFFISQASLKLANQMTEKLRWKWDKVAFSLWFILSEKNTIISDSVKWNLLKYVFWKIIRNLFLKKDLWNKLSS